MRPYRQATIFGLCLTFCASATAFGAEPIANVGSLTCELAGPQDVPAKKSTVAEVKCRFDAIVGVDFTIDGRIERVASSGERDAPAILSWAVLAPTPRIDAKQLAGRFTGTVADKRLDESTSKGGLFAASGNGIILRPLRALPEGLDEAGITILILDDPTVKV